MTDETIEYLMHTMTDEEWIDRVESPDHVGAIFTAETKAAIRARVRDLAASLNNTRRARLRSIHDCESVHWSKSPNVFRAMMAMGLIRRERHRTRSGRSMAWAFAEPLGRAVLRVLGSEGA